MSGAARPVKRSFSIRGHRTSISLEAPFWDALKQAAAREGVSLASLIARIDEARGTAGLSSAVRVWILDDVRTVASVTQYDGGNRD
ncbi:arylsulfate sulfotransferase [Hyphomicrobium nitrativorans NL23]|uniref:Arylsulfate sulfotransferase n=1 Tax=Hyphomicrobium nitrativorans NL23 TaxID=1029756 RepID=V5SG48_9HYPH|nr:ribbon-helix-helix domain-containing protein [Hyphomicrobium nitrativorans]AHB49513.1 arylsulfate sulfotransferase [Hyphomicrobium nitrativorans NL23]